MAHARNQTFTRTIQLRDQLEMKSEENERNSKGDGIDWRQPEADVGERTVLDEVGRVIAIPSRGGKVAKREHQSVDGVVSRMKKAVNDEKMKK